MIKTWEGEELWIEIIEKELYPPETITLPHLINELLKDENFQGKKVLAYGCGTGRFGAIAKERGAYVVGVDISDKILQIASKKIKVIKGDGTELPFKDKSFDYVFCFLVLMLIEDYEKAINEISRVSKQGGKLYFGIIHPAFEKWDPKTGFQLPDLQINTYLQTQQRLWTFYLTDGRKIDMQYTHRPLEDYFNTLCKQFKLEQIIESLRPPEISMEYAGIEYLFGEFIKM